MQRHSYLTDLMMMYTGATASRARGVFIGIVASAVVGYALKLLVVLSFHSSSIWLSIPIFYGVVYIVPPTGHVHHH